MKNNFKCPFCNGYLNIDNRVVLSARSKNGYSGILLLNSELGNYSCESNEHFKVEEGENIELKCPICSKSLNFDKSDELAHILMVDESNSVFDVYFSKVKGVRSTYKIVGDHVSYYGDHSSKYIDFFNLSQLT